MEVAAHRHTAKVTPDHFVPHAEGPIPHSARRNHSLPPFSSEEPFPELCPHKPKQGPRATDEARRLPPRRQGDAGPLCAVRSRPLPPFCSAKTLPRALNNPGSFPELCPHTNRNKGRAPPMRPAAYRHAARATPDHSVPRAVAPIPHSARRKISLEHCL